MNRTNDTSTSMADRIAALESQLSKVESSLKAAQRRGRNAWLASGLILFSAITLAANPQVQAQFGITLTSLNTRLTAVETKTTPLSYNAGSKLLTISGANVMVVDGTGSTESTSGLGNLQVGYNALRGDGNVRTGSHNLILGDSNNYSTSGGLVAGLSNEITGRYATVTGGTFNAANGNFASVSGGTSNSADGEASSISGGFDNLANGLRSTVTGGSQNAATAETASISGGVLNVASGTSSAISAGVFNTARGNFSSVSGGQQNLASAVISSISGGSSNFATGALSSILGGNSISLSTPSGTYPPGP
jgi:hypothetical protein